MKKRLLAGAALTMLMSVSMMAGATYALFTSESETDLTITSGKVDVRSNVVDGSVKLYSRDELVTGSNFANGGSAALEGNKLTLDKLTPGDKIEFEFEIANYSNVATKYRCGLKCEKGFKLFSGLNINFNASTPWTDLEAVTDATHPVVKKSVATIELPIDAGNEFQGLNTEITIFVEAVQGNADVEDKIIEYVPHSSYFRIPKPEQTNKDLHVETDTGYATIDIPKSALPHAEEEIYFSVKRNTSTDREEFNIPAYQTVSMYDITLTGLPNPHTSYYDVNLFVGKGYEDGKFRALHKHDNIIEELKWVTYHPETGYLEISTKSFSTFAITYEKTSGVTNKNSAELTTKELQKVVDNNSYVKLNSDLVLKAKDFVEDGARHITPIINITHDLDIDFNGHKISLEQENGLLQDVPAVFYVGEGANNVTFHGNGVLDTELGENTVYGINVKNPTANVTIKDGTYLGSGTAIQVSQGTANIEGGSFDLAKTPKSNDVDRQNSTYLLNCIDGNYNSGLAHFNISGGEFVNFNPAVVDAERVNPITGKYDSWVSERHYVDTTVVSEKETVYKVDSTTVLSNKINALDSWTLDHDYYIAPSQAKITIDGISIFKITKDFTLDLNGHNIFVNCVEKDGFYTPTFLFNVMGATMTVKGEGTISADNIGGNGVYLFVGQNKATINIGSGNFVGGPDVVYLREATTNITGGHFEASKTTTQEDPNANNFVLNCEDKYFTSGKAKYIVTGGEFVNFDPAHSHGENPEGNYVPSTHTSTESTVDGNKVYTVTANA